MNRYGIDMKIKEMEEEMSRFEHEISVHSMMVQSEIDSVPYGNRNQGGGLSLQFVPHQLQHNPHMDNSLDYTSNGHQAAPSSGPTLGQGPVVIQASPAVYAAPPVKTVQPEPVVPVFETIPIPIVATKPIIKFADVDVSVPPPMLIPSISKQVSSSYAVHDEQQTGKKNKKRKIIRTAGGQNWEDASLQEWETDDFRIFCGDLGNDVTDEVLTRAFSKYPSFLKAKVIRDKRNNKTKGFGFVSFRDPQDFIRAMREMNGKYVGSRPIKLRKSTWKDRNCDVVKKKMKEKQRLGLR